MSYRIIPGMQQIETAPGAFLHLFGQWQPERIVELGCGNGLWTTCLSMLAGPRVRVYAFDTRIMRRPVMCSITWREVDCWEVRAEIERLIAGDGPTLLLCDGGNKIREFNSFAPALKLGDVVAAHDYSPTSREFAEITRPLIWGHCEITDERIAETLRDCRLEPFHMEVMREALWGCWRRRPWIS